MTEIKKHENNQSVEYSFKPKKVMEQVAQIQNLMKQAMKKGEHYDKIEGCGPKNVLLKSGAEKLSFMFRFAPEFEINKVDFENGHREYEIKTRLVHIPTNTFVGEGVGSCSTLESKYRYRWDLIKDEDGNAKKIPREYWKTRNKELLGNIDYETRKKGGAWFIYLRVEYDNPADYYNTILKMGKKRSLVDAILTATAASDIFTQDIEELAEAGLIEKEEAQEDKRKQKEMDTKFDEYADGTQVVDINKEEKVSEESQDVRKMSKMADKLFRRLDSVHKGDTEKIKGELIALTFDKGKSVDSFFKLTDKQAERALLLFEKKRFNDQIDEYIPGNQKENYIIELTANAEKGIKGIDSVDKFKTIESLYVAKGKFSEDKKAGLIKKLE